MSKKIAIVLSGCGHLDGAEIRESILTLLELDRHSVEYQVFAPDKPQYDVIDHKTQQAQNTEKRNTLIEASRITRGQVSPLNQLIADQFDGLIIPGGFGVAKNLSSFALNGIKGEVDPKFKEIILRFFDQQKPIGAICIAPAILAMLLGEKGISLTIGNQEDLARTLESTGAKHINCAPNEIHHDKKHRIITTPAYMYDDAPLHHVQEGISQLVKLVAAL